MTVVAVCLALTGPSWGDTWNGDGNGWDYNDGDNWTADVVPDGVVAFIDGAYSAVLQDNVPNVSALRVNGGADLTVKTGANLAVMGGLFEVGKAGSAGTVLQEDGDISTSTGDLYLGDDEDSHGTYTMKAGSLTVGDDMKIGNESPAEFYMQGGTLDVDDYIGIACKDDVGAVGLFEISGGSVTVGAELIVGDSNTATLRIIGDDATIECDIYQQFFAGSQNGILEIVLKGGGISTINCGSMLLAGTLDVTLDPSFTATAGDYDIIVATGTRTGTFGTVNLPPGDWTLNYVAGSETVRLTYVPEPATMSLLAIGGLALIRRRRRTQ